MPDIFLSYSREDQEVARRFAEAFERQGFTVWWDATLRSGEAYDEVTEAALRSAKAVVVLWSTNSVVSRWVRAEATMANRNKTLMPVMIEPCERPIMFELTQTAELGHWEGDAGDKAWQAFVADIRRLADKDETKPAPRPAPAVGGVPSVAVLPIVSRSGVAEDADFAEDMTDEVIAALSLHGYFRVIASGTAAAYRGKAIDLRIIGRELDARYVVEGNVRRVGPNLRMMFQLVETETSNILSSSKYVRPLAELADVQDDLLTEIASDIGDRVMHIEFERAKKKTTDLSAWERVLRARGSFSRMGSENLRIGTDEARQAVAIAPDFGLAHALLATALATDFFMSASTDPERKREVRVHIKRALDLDGDNPNVLNVVSASSICIGDPQAALRYSQRAVQLVPNIGHAHHHLGAVYLNLGRTAEAIAEFDADERLAPHSNLRYVSLATRGLAYLIQGQVAEASASLDRSLQLNPNFLLTLKWKAIVAAMLDHPHEASDAVRRMREAEPTYTLELHEAQNLRAVPDKALSAKANAILRKIWNAMPEGAPRP